MSPSREAGFQAIPPERFSIIMDSISDGVFTVDNGFVITSFNRAAARITGVSVDDAIGRRCCDVFRASICEAGCALQHTVESGEPVINKSVQITTAEGIQIPISISTALLRDGPDGQVIGGVETFRDLSLVEDLRRELSGRYSCGDIISKSRRMLHLFEILPQIAESETTVLVEGESGTGKELFARALHDLSTRSGKPFVAVNCAALPDTLLESELFGYKAGAFTDARTDKPGRFAAAEGGTLFLDEIGDISPALQVRLLRVLQERSYEPLGGDGPVPADVRIITATNRSLSGLVESGEFREDLFYRINVINLELPPLRDRIEDVPLLVDHFIGAFNRRFNKDVAGISTSALAVLMEHDFPGNVRELENIIEHVFVLCSGGMIEVRHLPDSLGRKGEGMGSAPLPGTTLQQVERWMILDSMRRNDWNRQLTAKELGIHKSTLYRKIERLGIDLPEKDGRSVG